MHGREQQRLGTDGGVHNFLRYIEDWSARPCGTKVRSLALYTSHMPPELKCLHGYSPPARNYSFGQLFLNPADLPQASGFTDTVNLTYRQDFTPN